MLQLDGVYKSYMQKTVLNGLSFSVADKEKTALMGASGCGKTTLLRIIAGLEKADKGTVSFSEGKPPVSVCFAEPRLFPSFTVLENVLCVLPKQGEEEKQKCRAILEALGLGNALFLKPGELSTGMAQRVSLARAVAYDAPLFLLDEPFRGLDEESRLQVMAYLKEVLSQKTLIMVTHAREEADALCSSVYRIHEGKTELYTR